MKFLRLSLLTVIAMLAISPLCLAQGADQQPQQTVADGDHLAFMQQDQAPQAEEQGSGSIIVKTIGAMVIVVGLIFVAGWGMKKAGFGGPKSVESEDVDLAILSTMQMGNGRTISAIKFGGRTLLVGSTNENFTLLAEDTKEQQFESRGLRSVADILNDDEHDFAADLASAEGNLDLNPLGGLRA